MLGVSTYLFLILGILRIISHKLHVCIGALKVPVIPFVKEDWFTTRASIINVIVMPFGKCFTSIWHLADPPAGNYSTTIPSQATRGRVSIS
jgi:hypothetical protein